MDHILDSESEEIGLGEWRRKATDVILIVSIIVHLPLLIVALINYFPGTTRPFRILSIAVYTTLLVLLLLRRVSYRIRVRILCQRMASRRFRQNALVPLSSSTSIR